MTLKFYQETPTADKHFFDNVARYKINSQILVVLLHTNSKCTEEKNQGNSTSNNSLK